MILKMEIEDTAFIDLNNMLKIDQSEWDAITKCEERTPAAEYASQILNARKCLGFSVYGERCVRNWTFPPEGSIVCM